MPKFLTFLLLLLLSVLTMHAQKIVEKEYDIATINSLLIDGDGVYEIKIIAEHRSTVSLKATIAGETAENLMITKKNIEKSIAFGVDYSPYFFPENDKLAAHKVLSVILEFRIPEGMQVEIKSDIGSVTASGSYKSLFVSLERGGFVATNFFGNANIMTLSGDIKISVLGNVSGSAISKNGSVSNTLSKYYKMHISAESRNGNITLTQTEN